jgi:trimeric autotransporter adhesin
LKKLVLIAAALAALAFSPAAAAHSSVSLATVLSHTRAADRALDRAVSEFNAHAYGAARHDLALNRAQMGQAVAEKAKLIADATTQAQRLAAAKAVVAVAHQATVDEKPLAKSARHLRRGSRLQHKVMHAASQDAARAKALAVLDNLLASLPDAAQTHVSNAVAQLTLSHAGAVRQLGKDVTSSAVGRAAKAMAAADIGADVHGQAHAINLLQALMPLLPATAQNGLETALGAIGTSLEGQANGLAAVKAHAPAALQDEIAAAIASAQAAASDAKN